MEKSDKIKRILIGLACAAVGLGGFIFFRIRVMDEAVLLAARDNCLAVALNTVLPVAGGAALLLLWLFGIAVMLSAALPDLRIGGVCLSWLACIAIAASSLHGSLTILHGRGADAVPVTAPASVSAETESPDREATAAGPFASFATTTLSGDPADQSLLAGKKVTVINCWATFCVPCVKEMPVLDQLNQEYAGRGLQVIGLCGDVFDKDTNAVDDDTLDDAKDIAEKTGVQYPQLIPSAELMYGALADVQSYPVTFFVDEQGNVLRRKQGGTDEKGWRTLFDEVLSEL